MALLVAYCKIRDIHNFEKLPEPLLCQRLEISKRYISFLETDKNAPAEFTSQNIKLKGDVNDVIVLIEIISI